MNIGATGNVEWGPVTGPTRPHPRASYTVVTLLKFPLNSMHMAPFSVNITHTELCFGYGGFSSGVGLGLDQ